MGIVTSESSRRLRSLEVYERYNLDFPERFSWCVPRLPALAAMHRLTSRSTKSLPYGDSSPKN